MSFRIVIFWMLTFCLPSVSFAEIDWNDGKVQWHSYVDGLLAAKKENKNILVIVYADWCGASKQYSKMFFDPEVIESSKNVVLIKLNQDTDKQFTKKYSLDGDYVPRTYILGKDLNIRPSPYKSKKYDFYLPPGNNKYLASLLKNLKN